MGVFVHHNARLMTPNNLKWPKLICSMTPYTIKATHTNPDNLKMKMVTTILFSNHIL